MFHIPTLFSSEEEPWPALRALLRAYTKADIQVKLSICQQVAQMLWEASAQAELREHLQELEVYKPRTSRSGEFLPGLEGPELAAHQLGNAGLLGAKIGALAATLCASAHLLDL